MTHAITMRPPYLSVQIPSGTRTKEPLSTGMDMSKPNCVEFRLSIFLMGIPMTPNIIQTMKHTVKAKVLTISTDHACRVRWGLSPGDKAVDATAPCLCFCMALMVVRAQGFAHPPLEGVERGKRSSAGAMPSF